MLKKKISVVSLVTLVRLLMLMLANAGGAASGGSQYPYVGFNSSVAECLIEIILSGMTYHHWFEEFVKSKNIRLQFVSNEG